MHAIYLLSVWLHIMAAVVWVGGTLFLVFVLVPAIRQPQFAALAAALIRFTGRRFRWVAWICFTIFLLTGIVNLAVRGMGVDELRHAVFLARFFRNDTWHQACTCFCHSVDQRFSRFRSRAARGCCVGGESGIGGNFKAQTSSRACGSNQPAARAGGHLAGQHACARRALVNCGDPKHGVRIGNHIEEEDKSWKRRSEQHRDASGIVILDFPVSRF